MSIIITQDYVRSVFHFDPETGLMTRLKTVSGSGAVGDHVGTPNSHGHLIVRLHYKIYYVHRLAWFWMTGTWPKNKIDHIDGNRGNNRWTNLREATDAENSWNRRTAKNNTSGCRGVDWFKQYGRWRAQIRVKGQRRFLGYFDQKDDAIAARSAAEASFFGAFAPPPST